MATESWYKITFPFEEACPNGKAIALERAFAKILIANGGQPRSAALFAAHDDNFELYFYYFTPSAMHIAAGLVHAHNAVACEQPKRGTVFQRVGQYAMEDFQ